VWWWWRFEWCVVGAEQPRIEWIAAPLPDLIAPQGVVTIRAIGTGNGPSSECSLLDVRPRAHSDMASASICIARLRLAHLL